MALPMGCGTPSREPKKWYENRDNSGSFLSERRRGCVGCMVRPLVSRPMTGPMDTRKLLKRMRCAQCGKDEAHAYCTLCHHYFHDVPKLLPSGPVCGLVENMRFLVSHANRRAKVWGESRRGAVPRVDSVHHGPVIGIYVVVVLSP